MLLVNYTIGWLCYHTPNYAMYSTEHVGHGKVTQLVQELSWD